MADIPASFCLTEIAQLVTLNVPGLSGPIPPSLLEESQILQQAWLQIENGLVKAYGPMANCPTEVPHISVAGKTVVPGLVDPHTHLVFAASREHELVERIQKRRQISKGQRMSGGINYTVSQTRQASYEQLLQSALQRLDLMLTHGTTTVEAKSGYGLSLEHEIKLLEVIQAANQQHACEVVSTFLGAHAVPPEMTQSDYVQSVLGMIPEIAQRGLAEFCDVFCEEGFFTVEESRQILSLAKQHGLKLKIHADELAASGGSALAAELGAISADHLQFADRDSLLAMKAAGTLPVLLPGTAFYLGLPYANSDLMRELDLPMALSTDLNPGGCNCESQLLMITLAVTQMQMLPLEALAGATLNAAYAIDRGEQLGSLRPGKQADLLVLNAPNWDYMPYRLGMNLVEQVYKKGIRVIDSKG